MSPTQQRRMNMCCARGRAALIQMWANTCLPVISEEAIDWAAGEKLTGELILYSRRFCSLAGATPGLGSGGRAYKTQLLPHWLARWISTYWDWTVLDLCLYVCANVCLKHNRPWQGSMLPCDTAYSPDRCSLPHTTRRSLLNSLGICTNRIN